jgi:multidrug efflux pump subunit AcrA (membrane-fusion protein)
MSASSRRIAELESSAQQAAAKSAATEASMLQLQNELREAQALVAEAEASLASQQQSTAAHESVVRALQGQLVRLSEGFNKQVEEVFALQQQLQAAKASSVDKAIARSWVVNYVESGNTARGDEMLQLMAEWWDFSEADMQLFQLRERWRRHWTTSRSRQPVTKQRCSSSRRRT